MSGYVALIVIAVLVAAALIWWLISQNSGSKGAGIETKPPLPKSIDAPPVAAAAPPTPEKAQTRQKVAVAPLMADPTQASKTAPPKPQKEPLKKAATKATPTKAAKPAATKSAAPKASVPKPVVEKVASAVPKVAPAKPKAVAKPKAAALVKSKAPAKPKAAPKVVIPDNLELLKGVGPKLNALLKTLGVTSFEQVANWSAADVAEIDAKLGTFAGRISRDNWIDQSKLLSAGDIAGFEKKYGSLGSEIQKG